MTNPQSDPKPQPERNIYFLSDHTGITVETLGQALLAQFPDLHFRRTNIPYIDTPDKARAIAARISSENPADQPAPIIFSTLPDAEVRAILARNHGLFLDFLEIFIAPLEETLGVQSSHTDGKTHGFSGDYQQRIDAINFALAHDDGVDGRSLELADVILVGVSRSGKTPTCLYLSMQFGINAANFPLTEEDLEELRLPQSLHPHRQKLFGLTIDPIHIQQIRQERRPNSRYASLEQCRYEVRQAEQLMRKERIPYLDSTYLSIEELATRIMQERNLKRRVY